MLCVADGQFGADRNFVAMLQRSALHMMYDLHGEVPLVRYVRDAFDNDLYHSQIWQLAYSTLSVICSFSTDLLSPVDVGRDYAAMRSQCHCTWFTTCQPMD